MFHFFQPFYSFIARIAIEVCGRNQCALNQNRWLLGIYRTKLRQLSAVGYEVLLVSILIIIIINIIRESHDLQHLEET